MNRRLISILLTIIVFLSGGIGAFKGANPFNDLQINGTENAEAVAGFMTGVTGGLTELIQVGKVTKSGLPVAREITAIQDILGAIGDIPIKFIPYNR